MKNKKSIITVLFYLFVICFLLLTFMPFAIMVSGSFKTDTEMNNFPLRLIPKDPTLLNYKVLFDTIPFWRQFLNSLMVSVISAVCAMTINTCVAYGLTRFDFKGKKMFFSLILATMLIPGQVYMVPQFQFYQKLHLFGTYVPLIIPSMMSAFGIFLIRQVMIQVPKDLYESATIDGCGEMRILASIAVPLCIAGIGVHGVLTFMGTWNDFMTPLIYLKSEKTYTLSIGLMRLQNFYKISYGSPLGGAFLSCIPVILLLTLVGQKYFIAGMTAGSIKG